MCLFCVFIAAENLQLVPLGNPKHLSHTVRGVAQAGNKIYIIYEETNIINVFSNEPPFESLKTIAINDLKEPKDIVACNETLQLFVGDGAGAIWRMNIESDNNEFVKIGDIKVDSMSLTSLRLLVITNSWPAWLYVYDIGDRDTFKQQSETKLPEAVCSIARHAVQSSSGTFFVSHCNSLSNKNQVSEVSLNGEIMCSTSDKLNLSCPTRLAMASDGGVLVTDTGHDCIFLLDKTLKSEPHVILPCDRSTKRKLLNLNYSKNGNLIVAFKTGTNTRCETKSDIQVYRLQEGKRFQILC
jgi:hypothetical protein